MLHPYPIPTNRRSWFRITSRYNSFKGPLYLSRSLSPSLSLSVYLYSPSLNISVYLTPFSYLSLYPSLCLFLFFSLSPSHFLCFSPSPVFLFPAVCSATLVYLSSPSLLLYPYPLSPSLYSLSIPLPPSVCLHLCLPLSVSLPPSQPPTARQLQARLSSTVDGEWIHMVRVYFATQLSLFAFMFASRIIDGARPAGEHSSTRVVYLFPDTMFRHLDGR